MAQATRYDQFQEDPSLNDQEGGGKTGFLPKMKDETKNNRRKLKSKLKPGSNTSDTTETGESYGSDEEEEDATPPQNALSGQTQSAYDQNSDQDPIGTTGPTSDEGLTKSFEGLSTNKSTNEGENPTTEKFSDNLTSAKDQRKEILVGSGNSESQYTSPDAPPATEQVGQQTQQLGDKASEAGKSWIQWAAEKVGFAKDTAAAKAPTTAYRKPIHHQASDTFVGAKDSAANNAYGTTDSLAAQSNPDQIPSDTAQQTYVQKAAGAAYGAKDSLYSKVQPGEHDKALSKKVPESVGNLPATLKSHLPSGKPASSTTTTTASPVSSTLDGGDNFNGCVIS